MTILLNNTIDETDTDEESFAESNKIFDHDKSIKVYANKSENFDTEHGYDESTAIPATLSLLKYLDVGT